jgi:hypothetical protein
MCLYEWAHVDADGNIVGEWHDPGRDVCKLIGANLDIWLRRHDSNDRRAKLFTRVLPTVNDLSGLSGHFVAKFFKEGMLYYRNPSDFSYIAFRRTVNLHVVLKLNAAVPSICADVFYDRADSDMIQAEFFTSGLSETPLYGVWIPDNWTFGKLMSIFKEYAQRHNAITGQSTVVIDNYQNIHPRSLLKNLLADRQRNDKRPASEDDDDDDYEGFAEVSRKLVTLRP